MIQVRPGKANQIIGRWHDVRLYGPQGTSAPYIFDRRNGYLTPHRRDEWVYDDETEQWFAAVKGGAGWSSDLQHPRIGLLGPSGSITSSTFALNVQYVYGTSGRAVGMRIKLSAAKTVSAVYAYLDSKTGSPTTLDWEIRNSTSNAPGSTVLGSGTVNISGVTAPSWISASSLSIALSANTEYWLCWGNTLSDAATNTGTVWSGNGFYISRVDHSNNDGLNTTGGFGSGNTVQTRVPTLVIGFNDSTAIGSCFTVNTTVASDTNRRGMYFSTGFTEQLKFWGFLTSGSQLTNGSGLELYDSTATVPGTGALSIGTVHVAVQGGNSNGYYLATPYTFAKNLGYRVVYTFSGVTTAPGYWDIGTGADSVLAQAMLGGGSWYYSRANGTTNWNNDVTTGFARADLIIENQVAVAGGLARIIGG